MKVEDLKIWDALEVVTAMPGIPAGITGAVTSINREAKTVSCAVVFDIPFECIEHDKVRRTSNAPVFMGGPETQEEVAEVLKEIYPVGRQLDLGKVLEEKVPGVPIPVWKETLDGGLNLNGLEEGEIKNEQANPHNMLNHNAGKIEKKGKDGK